MPAQVRLRRSSASSKARPFQPQSRWMKQALPVTGADGQSQILGGVATISRVQSPAVVTHYNIEPTLDLYANVQGRDLGGREFGRVEVGVRVDPQGRHSCAYKLGQAL